MSFKALILSATAGAVALVAAVLFFLPAAAADTSAADGGATTQPASADEGIATMPADCPMWDETESADAVGMHEQCRTCMSDSGMGQMMGMKRMMGSGGMHMNGSGGMAGQAAEADDDATWCPLAEAEPGAGQAVMGGCYPTETDN